MVIAGPGNYPERAEIQVFGECRNMNDHHGQTGPFAITEQLRR